MNKNYVVFNSMLFGGEDRFVIKLLKFNVMGSILKIC